VSLASDLRLVVMSAICFHEGFTVKDDRDPAAIRELTAACRRIAQMVGIDYTFGVDLVVAAPGEPERTQR
jgi:hypothetical protein